jgi:hypothetical protein
VNVVAPLALNIAVVYKQPLVGMLMVVATVRLFAVTVFASVGDDELSLICRHSATNIVREPVPAMTTSTVAVVPVGTRAEAIAVPCLVGVVVTAVWIVAATPPMVTLVRTDAAASFRQLTAQIMRRVASAAPMFWDVKDLVVEVPVIPEETCRKVLEIGVTVLPLTIGSTMPGSRHGLKSTGLLISGAGIIIAGLGGNHKSIMGCPSGSR